MLDHTGYGTVTLAALAAVPRWVAWQTEDAGTPEKPRVTKVPYGPRTGRPAKSNDPSTWGTREEAEARAAKLPMPFGSGGVGIMLGELDGQCLGGTDLDTCLTAAGAAPWAAAVQERLGTYAEVSPSGSGVKLFFTYRAEDAVAIRQQLGTATGRKWCEAGKKEHPPGIELYVAGRFFAVTDKHVDGTPAELRQAGPDDLAWLIQHAARQFLKVSGKSGRPRKDGGGDQSRSARAMSVAARVKGSGGSYENFKAALRGDPELADWLEAKGLPDGEREARRAWKRCGQAGLIETEGGLPAACEANVRRILETDARWEGVLGYDEFASEMVLRRAPPWAKDGAGWKPRALEDSDLAEIAMWLQENGLPLISVPKVVNAAAAVCRAHGFHPVRDYLDALRWDGTHRLDTWLRDYVGAEHNDYTSAVGARWMIGAAARIYRPGCKLDTALILEGPQRIKKSTAAAVLGGAWFTDTPQDLRSKDAMQDLQGVWIVELAELTALGTAGQERIKSFMSSGTDRFRPSYGRLVKAHPRQCAFIGTYNPDGAGFLKDPTGGSRWWPVQCGQSIDIDALRRDRDQLWAEAAHRFRAGEKWWIEEAGLMKLAKAQQEERYDEDARAAGIREWAAKNVRGDDPSVSVAEVLVGFFRLNPEDPSKWEDKLQKLVGKTLKKAGWVRKQEDRKWRWFAPEDPDLDEGLCTSSSAPSPTGARTGARETQEHQGVHQYTSCTSRFSSSKQAENTESAANGPNGANKHFPPRKFGNALLDRCTGARPDGTPACTREHCPGRWAETQEGQRVCRCSDPHCYLGGLVAGRAPVQGVHQ